MLLSISDNFIKRPILTTVCTLLIVLAGLICIPLLPVSYLPPLTPVTIQVSSRLIGGDALTVENTVTTPLEREINGAQNMQFMTSNSTANGTSIITAYFRPDQDASLAQVDVQNRVGIAAPLLPTQVQQQGIRVEQSSPAIVQAIGIYSPDDSLDPKFISNYVDLFIKDEITRIPGVAQIVDLGELLYSMRIWVDPKALASRGLTAQDVIRRVQEQNPLVGLGGIGLPPSAEDQSFLFTIPSKTQLRNAKEFEDLVLKTEPNGDLVKLKDVGRAELGAQDYSTASFINGHQGQTMLIFQNATANALNIAKAVDEKLTELRKNFPPGLVAEVVFDTTRFVEVSTDEVISKLISAIVLVVLMIYIFLQDWRALIVPVIAMPVAMTGALVFSYILGFSLNALTLLGLVLGTGMLVDDGIVVVEAIVEKLDEDPSLTARQAALTVMGKLSRALIGTTLVLMAVFLPVTFFPGTTGRIYQQFALIIAFAMLVSAFNGLTFNPSMGALILKPHDHGEKTGPLGWFFNGFNRGFNWFKERYISLVEALIRARYLMLVVFGIAIVSIVSLFQTIPSGFVPTEDQGAFIGIINAPPGVSLSYTNKVAEQIWQKLQKYEEIDYLTVVTGFSNRGNGPNVGTLYVSLKPWSDRTHPDQQIDGLLRRINRDLSTIQDARVNAINLPAILGLGNYGGNEFQFQDRSGGNLTFDQFVANASEIIAQARDNPIFGGNVFSPNPPSVPQLEVKIDRERLQTLNVNFNDAMTTLGTYLGSSFVSQFSFGPRYYQVYVQADAPFRDSPAALSQIYVRSQNNQMIPLSELVTVKQTTGPQVINHFNIFRSLDIVSAPAPGHSTGQAIDGMVEAYRAKALPATGYEWYGAAREELAAGRLGPIIFALGLIVVFLLLAALFESYIDPLIIMLTVPLAIVGALSFTLLRGLDNNVFSQVALLMLIGLAAKGSILVVELANNYSAAGASYAQAIVKALRERLRPILMTVAADIAGFLPLMVSTGAGSASRLSVGFAVFGGVIALAMANLLMLPVLYVVIKSLTERFTGGKPPQSPESVAADGKSAAQPMNSDLSPVDASSSTT